MSWAEDLQEAVKPTEDWPNFGLTPIESPAIEAATRLLNSLPSWVTRRPLMQPMTRGRFQLVWLGGPRQSVEVEFENSSLIHYLKWGPDEGIAEEDIIPSDDIETIVRLLSWLYPERNCS